MALVPLSPVAALPQDPAQEDRGDFVILPQAAAGQGQDQQEVEHREAVENQMAVQTESSVSFTQRPTYSEQISADGDFTARFEFSNSSPALRRGYVMVGFTPVGTENTRELYQSVFIPPGTSSRDIIFSNARLRAAGITPGQYGLTFLAFNELDQRIGAGFYGNPFTFGTVSPVFDARPSYTPQIARDGGFQAAFTVGNTGDSPARVTLLTVLTPAGATDPSESKEFYRAVTVPVGGGQIDFSLSPAELAAAGIAPGRFTAAFAAFDSFDRRLGGPTFGFFGNPLTIGDIQVSLPTAPVLPSAMGSNDNLTAEFTFVNSGDTADRVTALLVLTPVGATDPSQSKEFYITRLPAGPGSSTHTVTVTAAQLAAAGITPGNWLITATGFDGAETRLQSYYGNPLTIGSASPALPAEPAYTDQIALDGVLPTDWDLTNSGDAPATVTLVTALTPVGGDSSQTVEFTRTVRVPPGGASFDFDIPASERTAAGIGGGDYLVSFVALDAAGNRLGEFFGNLLEIGNIQPALNAGPAYPEAIEPGTALETDWLLQNPGDAPGFVTLVIGVTATGQTATTAMVEFSKNVQVAAGGQGFDFDVSGQDLTAAGIRAGEWLLSFIAFRPDGTRIGEFFGNPLTIGEGSASLPSAPAYSDSIPVDGTFQSSWTLQNPGPASETVELVVAMTPFTDFATTSTVEFSKTVQVPANGEMFLFEITPQELSNAGIGPGRHRLAFVAIDSQGSRIGEFFGQVLTVGSIIPAFDSVPTYTSPVAVGSPVETDWTLENSGNAPDLVTLLVVITPVGSSDPSASREFYRAAVLSPGGGNFEFDLTGQQLADAGIGAGQYTVTFLAFNGLDQRIGSGFFGNLLEIGQGQPQFEAAPTYVYPAQIVEGQSLVSDWTLGNLGAVNAPVTLVTVFTPEAESAGTAGVVEFRRPVTVLPGGGIFTVEITGQEFQSAGIGPGRYTLSFRVLDGAGNGVGLVSAGNPLDVLPAGTPLAFLVGQRAQDAPGSRWRFLQTWAVDPSDSLFNQLTDRAFSYDQAVAAIGFLSAGDVEQARVILQEFVNQEAGSGRIGFMYGLSDSIPDFSAVFTGTNAWVGDALVSYGLLTGDLLTWDFEFRPTVERIADTLLSFRDPATGLFRGGLNADGQPFPWISTEHNLDVWSFFDDLAVLTGESRYADVARSLSDAIDTHLWAGTHFLNGLGDDLVSLDSQALGGVFLVLERGDLDRAAILRDFIDQNLLRTVEVNGVSVTGYAPYRQDSFVWSEGSLQVAFMDFWMGRFASAQTIVDQMDSLRAGPGGLNYSSSTASSAAPGVDATFPALPHVGATGWDLLVRAYLEAVSASPTVPTAPASVSTPAVVNSPAAAPVSPAVSQPSAPSIRLSDFRLIAPELAMLSITPGFYSYSFSSAVYRDVADRISDGFFRALLEFLFE